MGKPRTAARADRRGGRLPALALALAAVVAAGLASRALGPPAQPAPPESGGHPTTATEPAPTEAAPRHARELARLPTLTPATVAGVLAISDHDGIVLLGPSSGFTRRYESPETTQGDPPHRLLRRGDHLVLWTPSGPVVFHPARPERGFRPLLEGTWFLPGVAEDRLWIARGRMGQWPLDLVEVDLTGAVHRQALLPADHFPVAEWAGRLVVDVLGELRLWDPRTGQVSETIGRGSVVAARGEVLVWCPAQCLELRVRTGERTTTVPAPTDLSFNPASARLSPDGTMLATSLTKPLQPDIVGPVVVDLAGRAVQRLHASALEKWPGALTWSADGAHLILPVALGGFVVWDRSTGDLARLATRFHIEPWHGLTAVEGWEPSVYD